MIQQCDIAIFARRTQFLPKCLYGDLFLLKYIQNTSQKSKANHKMQNNYLFNITWYTEFFLVSILIDKSQTVLERTYNTTFMNENFVETCVFCYLSITEGQYY